MIKKGILFLLIFFLTSIAFAADYCVTPTGSGSQTGADWSNALPWSFTPVRDNAYYLADGVYGYKVLDVDTDGTKYITIAKATESYHVTDTGWSSDMGDGVAEFNESNNRGVFDIERAYIILDGSYKYGFKISDIGDAYGGITVHYDYRDITHHLILRNIEISEQTLGNTAIYAYLANGQGTGIDDPNILIENCYIHDMGELALKFNQGGYIVVRNNIIERTCQLDDTTHKEVMKVDDPTNYVWIYGNIFRDWNGYSVTGGIILSGQSDAADVAYWYIYNNLFYLTHANLNPGNRVIGGVDSSNANHHDIYVLNNTFYNMNPSACANTLADFGLWTSGNNVVENNLYVDSDGLSAIGKEGVTKDYNAFYNTPNYTDRQTNDVSCTVQPLRDPTGYDLHLADGAEVIGKGRDWSSIFNTDFDGNVRTPPWDMGAYEYSGQAPPTGKQLYNYGGNLATYNGVLIGE